MRMSQGYYYASSDTIQDSNMRLNWKWNFGQTLLNHSNARRLAHQGRVVPSGARDILTGVAKLKTAEEQ